MKTYVVLVKGNWETPWAEKALVFRHKSVAQGIVAREKRRFKANPSHRTFFGGQKLVYFGPHEQGTLPDFGKPMNPLTEKHFAQTLHGAKAFQRVYVMKNTRARRSR